MTMTPNPAPAAPTAESDLSGRLVDDFQVLRRLGQGGMGQVYLARQLSLKRNVALKILRPELAASPESLARFRAEAEAVARAAHANIVQVYAVGQADGLPYMALEFVDGMTLRDYLVKKGPPTVPQALGIMRQVAAALQRAGELGIVHRDIKPENILLSRQGEVKVADFGLSRCLRPDPSALMLTQTGMALGTPLYMSPEQVEGKPLDQRTDIYSFGVTCYQMLAGDPPFRGQTAFEVALRHVQAEPADLQALRPDLPAGLCAVIRRMMAKRPEDRYQTARELLRELSRVRQQQASSSPDDASREAPAESAVPVGAVVQPPTRRARRPWPALIVTGCLAAGLMVGWRWQRARETPGSRASLPAGEALAGDQQREQFLREAVAAYASPKDQSQVAIGLGSCLELGLFYLERGRLEDAELFFQGLISASPVRACAAVGRLGHAIVLAFQDRPAESCAAFLHIVNARGPAQAGLRFVLNRNPRFLRMVARALDRDAANCEAAALSFPPALQEWRKAQPLAAGAPGARLPRPADKTGRDRP